MPYALKNPIRPEAPSLVYQLITDSTVGNPQVAETPAIGFPWELSAVDIRNQRQGATFMQLTLLAVKEAYVSGEARSGHILHQVTGNGVNQVGRDLVYLPLAPLILRPRIRFYQAGWRIRLVHDQIDGTSMTRVLLTLTQLP